MMHISAPVLKYIKGIIKSKQLIRFLTLVERGLKLVFGYLPEVSARGKQSYSNICKGGFTSQGIKISNAHSTHPTYLMI